MLTHLLVMLLSFLLLSCALLQLTKADVFQPFPFAVNPLDIFNFTISQQCQKDVLAFLASLNKLRTTLIQCQQNGTWRCTKEQKQTLTENSFAIKQLDAFGKLPAALLNLALVSSGSYSECMDVVAPYRVQYCFVNAVPTDDINNFLPDTTLNRAVYDAGVGPKLAVCMPNSCTQQDITNFLNDANVNGTLPLEFTSTSCVPLSNQYTLSFWIFMSCVAFFVCWAVCATVADYVWQTSFEHKQQNKAIQVFFAYSLYSNGSQMMSVSQPKQGTIKSLASIRFISMTWVVAGHVLLTDASSGYESRIADRKALEAAYILSREPINGKNEQLSIINTLAPVLNIFDPLLSTTIINAFFSVDTFFVISGILVTYIFFKVRPSSKYIKSASLWIMWYVHRYIRLTPPIMVFIGFYVVVYPLINGPWTKTIFPFFDTEVATCEKYWWRNMLYINNFFRYDEMCYTITWYLAVDTQLYCIAPIFLIALFMSEVAGFILLIACVAASVGYVYAITIKNSFPAVITSMFALKNYEKFFTTHYEMPWTRCPPYFVGMIVGYILATKSKPKLSKFFVVLMWTLATAVALASLYGPHSYIKGESNWGVAVRATYNNFSRIGWALAVSWVVLANHWGWGGLIAEFMDHPMWQPLGRLSYCGYIVHRFLIRYVYNLDDRPAHFTSIWKTYVYMVIPVIVVSYVFAFFWSCLFEVPIVQLEKMLTSGLLPKQTSKSTSEDEIEQQTASNAADEIEQQTASNGNGAINGKC